MNGQELRESRTALGLTQKQLGAALDVNILTLRYWELGEDRHKPNPILLELALDAFRYLTTPAAEAARSRAALCGWEGAKAGDETDPSGSARALRERLGMSQPQFAAAFGVSLRTVESWEKRGGNHREPKQAMLGLATEAVLHLGTPAARAARDRATIFGWRGVPAAV